MEYEFIDDMLYRLFITEHKTIGETFREVVEKRATQIVDLGKIENAFQLFRKKKHESPEWLFRKYVYFMMPDDWPKCVRCFGWKKNWPEDNGV